MSLRERIAKASEDRTLELSTGWKVQVRPLLPADLVAGPAADDVQAWLSFSRGDLLTLKAISEGGPEAEEVKAQWRDELAKRRADSDLSARATRLHTAAILAAVVGLGAPGEPVEPIDLAEVDDEAATPLRLSTASLCELLGASAYVEAAEWILWRAVGGEAGQKTALAFRDVRKSTLALRNSKVLRGAPVQPAPVDGGGTSDQPDVLPAAPGSETEDGEKG
jgi:hypothetical protein